MGKEAFFTRARANKGIKLPLVDPATGQETEHWLRILGRESDAFRREDLDGRRRIVEKIKDIDPTNKTAVAEVLKKAEEDETRLMVASLVAEWSFSEPCTREAVVAFLREAPQIQDAIDRVATRRSLFFAGVSSSSPGTPNPKSDSTSAPKEANEVPETT